MRPSSSSRADSIQRSFGIGGLRLVAAVVAGGRDGADKAAPADPWFRTANRRCALPPRAGHGDLDGVERFARGDEERFSVGTAEAKVGG